MEDDVGLSIDHPGAALGAFVAERHRPLLYPPVLTEDRLVALQPAIDVGPLRLEPVKPRLVQPAAAGWTSLGLTGSRRSGPTSMAGCRATSLSSVSTGGYRSGRWRSATNAPSAAPGWSIERPTSSSIRSYSAEPRWQ